MHGRSHDLVHNSYSNFILQWMELCEAGIMWESGEREIRRSEEEGRGEEERQSEKGFGEERHGKEQEGKKTFPAKNDSIITGVLPVLDN